MTRTLILDANLLVLLTVGLYDKRLIKSHKRLSKYDEEDYELLRATVSRFQSLLITPNIVTEASNLVRMSTGEHRENFTRSLAEIVKKTAEENVPSADSVKHKHYVRLGLTDSAILFRLSNGGDLALLTDDLDLYLAALTDGYDAHNFTHIQESANRF